MIITCSCGNKVIIKNEKASYCKCNKRYEQKTIEMEIRENEKYICNRK